MNDSFSMTGHNCLYNLSEKVSGKLFFQTAFLSDEVKEIFTGFWSLHDYDEGVMTFVAVYQSDHSRGTSRHHVHQADFQWHTLAIYLKI